jgi:hypothetical protein
VKVDFCASSPCSNGGSCLDLGEEPDTGAESFLHFFFVVHYCLHCTLRQEKIPSPYFQIFLTLYFEVTGRVADSVHYVTVPYPAWQFNKRPDPDPTLDFWFQ